MEHLAPLALRVAVALLYLQVVLRLSGRRTLGDLSPVDFVLALVIGDLFDDVIWGEVPVQQWLVALTALIGGDVAVGWAVSRSPRLRRWLIGGALVLLRDGRFEPAGLRRERLPRETAEGLLREEEVADPAELRLATLEASGCLGVLYRPDCHPAQRRDLAALREGAASPHS